MSISVNLVRINPNGNLMKMTMRIRMIITALILLLSATLSAQSHQPSDLRLQPSDRMAAYREAIGLDMTVPDFSTKKIDAKVMGTRLAGYWNICLRISIKAFMEDTMLRS